MARTLIYLAAAVTIAVGHIQAGYFVKMVRTPSGADVVTIFQSAVQAVMLFRQ
jgi:hypothetical protein